MSITCPSCNADSPGSARFCIACGTSLATTASSSGSDAASPVPSAALPAGKHVFSVKWMLMAIVFIIGGVVGVSIVLGVIAGLLGADGGDDKTILLLGGVATALGFFIGAVATGWRSPGITIREPVVAIILVVVAFNLVTANIAGILVGWVIPALLAFAGARIGERMQRRQAG